ncbi:MAG: hypothetical protein LBU62_03420, partial [Bacteroidales bacterium]|nr:hypothetical protein [Bacteroidales bacterium]
MGTWGAGILDNDTSCEVRESFYEKYNLGVEAAQIFNALLEECESDLRDEERAYNVWLSLALCFWEIGILDDELKS